MRRLLYVPIIHADADLGSIAPAVSQMRLETLGKRRWLRHRGVVAAYWKHIRKYFNRVNANDLVIYQDGMMADGELGKRIVEEGATKGSPNHQIVLDLIHRGARLRKTEDADLLIREFHRILQIAATGPDAGEDILAHYRDEGEALMRERDRFIATTVNETLQKGEFGVLFLGALHNILPELNADVEVASLKDDKAVRSYLEELTLGSNREAFERLAQCMASDLPLTGPFELA